MNEIKTIGQAAGSYGKTKEAFQKQVSRAVKSDKFEALRAELGIGDDTQTGMRAPFTEALKVLIERTSGEQKEAISSEGERVPFKVEFKPVEPEQPEKPEKPEKPEVPAMPDIDYTSKLKPKAGLQLVFPVDESLAQDYFFEDETEVPAMPETPLPTAAGQTKKQADGRTILDRTFDTDGVTFVALGLLVLSDGYCFGRLASAAVVSDYALGFFSIIGCVVGFSGIKNAYDLSRKVRKSYENDPTGMWIAGFAVFQFLLHGSAFGLFSGWSALTTSEIIGRLLLCFATPVATSALSVTLFKK